MAAQPAEGAIPIVVVRDDNQPWLDDGDSDKYLIEGVPEELDEHFDKAVRFAKKYLGSREDIAGSIQKYLELYQSDDFDYTDRLDRPSTVPESHWEDIQALVKNVDVYYYMTLEDSEECRREVTKLLNEYCYKVESMHSGCLVAVLELIDDLQLSILLSNFTSIAKKIRAIVVNIDILKSVAEKRQEENIISEELKDFTLDVLTQVTDRVRIWISIERRQMLNMFEMLKSGKAYIELTVTAKMSSLTLPSSSDPDDVERANQRAEFLDKFKDFVLTYKALAEIVLSSEDYRRLVDDMEELKFEREQSKDEEFSEDIKKPPSGGTDSPQVYRGPLSPPSFSGAASADPLFEYQKFELVDTNVYLTNLPLDMTEQELFQRCRKFGTIFSLRIKKDILTKWQCGFVYFADSTSAEKAIAGLREYNAQKARKASLPELIEDTLLLRDVPSHTTREELIDKFGEFGELVKEECRIVPPRLPRQLYHGYIKFVVAADARRIMERLQGDGEFVVMARRRSEEPLERKGKEGYDVSDTNVCIENPPKDATDRVLFDLCRPFGTLLNVDAVVDRNTKLCRLGFVYFADSSEAERAIIKLADLRAKKAKKVEIPELSETTLMFKELPKGTDSTFLQTMCAEYGYPYQCNVSKPSAHHTYAYGFVQFFTADEARLALVDLQTKGVFVVMARK